MSLREKAERIFAEAVRGRIDRGATEREILVYERHSRGTAQVAETIAKEMGLDKDKAFACGLLHDVGRCEDMSMGHIIAGYKMMMAEGEPEIARICLTHSFYLKEKVDQIEFSSKEDTEYVRNYIHQVEYDEYDRLIQLADYMAGGSGITSIERRFASVLLRHGYAAPRKSLAALMKMKMDFDEKVGRNIYELFTEEIAETSIKSVGRKGAEALIDKILTTGKEWDA